ncbi:hypothetical protein [Umezawaea tangerina]|nr:hypothetical protein [Umezawaea tangerina]
MSWFRRKVSAMDHVPPSASESVFTTVLPSQLPGLRFQAQIAVSWREDADPGIGGPAARAEVRARAHIRRLAARITSRCTVLDCEQAADEVLLGLFKPAAVPGLPAMSTWIRDISLQASHADVAQAEEHLAAQRHEHLRAYRVRTQAENVRALLSEPGLAHAWFLASGRAEPNLDALKVLKEACDLVVKSGALTEAGPSTHDPLSHTVSLLLSRLDTTERQVLLDRLPAFLEMFGQGELGDQMRSGDSGGDLPTQWHMA